MRGQTGSMVLEFLYSPYTGKPCKYLQFLMSYCPCKTNKIMSFRNILLLECNRARTVTTCMFLVFLKGFSFFASTF